MLPSKYVHLNWIVPYKTKPLSASIILKTVEMFGCSDSIPEDDRMLLLYTLYDISLENGSCLPRLPRRRSGSHASALAGRIW